MDYSITERSNRYVVEGARRPLFFKDLKEARLILITLYYLKDMEYINNQSGENAESLAIKKILSAGIADKVGTAQILLWAGISKLNELLN